MNKDDFDVSEIINDILNPQKEWQEILENKENKAQESSEIKKVKEIHIYDKKKKKFVFPGNFVVRFEGDKIICSCE